MYDVPFNAATGLPSSHSADSTQLSSVIGAGMHTLTWYILCDDVLSIVHGRSRLPASTVSHCRPRHQEQVCTHLGTYCVYIYIT